jgi:hypothetical protein
MSERLFLERSLGAPGWRVWRLDDDAALLAALGHCLRHPAAAFTLRGLWRMVALWREGVASVDPAALRLALCVPRSLALTEVNVSVAVTLPGGGKRARRFRFDLQKAPVRGAGLASAPRACGWSVLQLGAEGAVQFDTLMGLLRSAPKATRVGIEVTADSLPVTERLRAAFPIRVDGRFGVTEDWVPLIGHQQVDLRLLAGEGA